MRYVWRITCWNGWVDGGPQRLIERRKRTRAVASEMDGLTPISRPERGVERERGRAEGAMLALKFTERGELEVVRVGDGFDGAEGDVVGGGEARYGGGFHVYEGRVVGGGEARFFLDAGDSGGGGEGDCGCGVWGGGGEALAGARVDDEGGFGGRAGGEGGRAASSEASGDECGDAAGGEGGLHGNGGACGSHACGDDDGAGQAMEMDAGAEERGIGRCAADERGNFAGQCGDDGGGGLHSVRS